MDNDVSDSPEIKLQQTISRREFLRVAGAAGGVFALASGLAGYGLYDAASGELPEARTPYDSSVQARQSDQTTPPILVVVGEKQANPFAGYLREILLAEGFTYFQVLSLAQVTQENLHAHPLVLLAECNLTTETLELFADYTGRGGRLIAMRPAPELAQKFGVRVTGGAQEHGYVRVDSSHPVMQAAPSETLQFFGAADHYELEGAEQIASLSNMPSSTSWLPAVTSINFGSGKACCWAFDLARSVVLARQGNPAWANEERDTRDGLRAQDMFVEWIDLDRIAIPQADELMRLFSRMMVEMLEGILPLPRIWYFPGQAPAMLIATGDAHANPAEQTDQVLRMIEEFNGAMSIY
jgi:hypothetical protein